MAEKIVSPGVFTREKDMSEIAQGVSEIGAAVIGITQKGPALVPLTCNSLNDFYAKFGPSSTTTTYVPRTVESYLKSAGVVTVVRVLGSSNWYTDLYNLTCNGNVVAVLAPTNGTTMHTTALEAFYTGSDTNATASAGFGLYVSASNHPLMSYSVSFSSTSQNYITKIFGTDPQGSKPLYVLSNLKEYQSNLGNGYVTASITSQTVSEGFTHATTPWIISQTISGQKYNLFKFHQIGDGNISNKEVKVAIVDVRKGTAANKYYGTFTLVIRNVNNVLNSQDSDKRPEATETFTGLTLDPESSNYLPKRIGDKYVSNTVVDGINRIVYSGSYDNVSKYVRVELASNSDAIPPEAVPFGFRALVNPHPSTVTNFPAAPMIVTQSIDGAWDSRKHFGFDYDVSSSAAYTYLAPLPASQTTGSNVDFTLENCQSGSSTVSVDSPIGYKKFVVPFQGGFDGMHPTQSIYTGDSITATNVFGYDCSTATSTGTVQWKKAIDAIASPEILDVNLIVIPGLLYSIHTQVCLYAKTVAETRGDCFYIMDLAESWKTPTDVITVLDTAPGEVDSNYTAVYYPWIKVLESTTRKPTWVPPSVIMPSVFAFNDKIAYEWYAPAGLNRGGLTDAVEAKYRLSRSEMDALYEARINPIATFPGQGIVAWGQKTLQVRASALDRINVRRLLINLKKFVASTSRYLVFEQNTAATRLRFLNIVNPYLSSVQQKQGIYAFKVIMDETNNTPDIIDQNILYGQIYLQPTRTAEFIVIDFNVLATGATFPNA